MSVRWWSLLVWALVGASAVFWGLRLWPVPPSAPPQAAAVVQPPDLLQVDWSRLAGGADPGVPPVDAVQAASPTVGGRSVLVGVVSPGVGPTGGAATAAGQTAPSVPANDGLALIAVDGKAPRAYALGSVVDGRWVLQAVSRRAVRLAQPGTAAEMLLIIPEPAAPARSGSSPAGA